MQQRLLVYIGAVAAAVVTIFGLLQFGDALAPAGGQIPSPPAHGILAQFLANANQPLPRLLAQLMVVMAVARGLGALATRIGQPAVVGEIAGGLLLGPSFLGWLSPTASVALFPAASMASLHALSQVGVLLFMFAVGLEMEPARMRGKGQAAVAVSHFSILVPFTLGVALSLGLYRSYAPAGIPFHAFALFCGIAMSITAFPVLARILEDRRLMDTPLGVTAITCAAVDDVTAWSLLALVVAITTSGGAMTTLLVTITALVAFVLVMIFGVRGWLRQLLSERITDENGPTRNQLALLLAVVLVSALVTEVIGVHALFGAFMAGAILPLTPALRRVIRERIEAVSAVLLLPLFFAYTGLRTQLGLLTTASSWLVCVVIIVVATAGKWGASTLAARWTGLSWRDSFALGSLMNTRGLMELIALNVGYDLGILSPEIFTMMVLMALITTAMTGPLLSVSLHASRRREEPEGANATAGTSRT